MSTLDIIIIMFVGGLVLGILILVTAVSIGYVVEKRSCADDEEPEEEPIFKSGGGS